VPGADLGAAAAALEFGVDVSAQKAQARLGPAFRLAHDHLWLGVINQVQLTGSGSIEAIHVNPPLRT
jgi:hypothetical protein